MKSGKGKFKLRNDYIKELQVCERNKMRGKFFMKIIIIILKFKR